MIKPTDPSQKKSMGWLVCIGVEVVDKSVYDGKHGVLHGACGIKVPPFKYTVLWAEDGMHGVGPHDAVALKLKQRRNGNGKGLTIAFRVAESQLQCPIDLCWAPQTQNHSGTHLPPKNLQTRFHTFFVLL